MYLPYASYVWTFVVIYFCPFWPYQSLYSVVDIQIDPEHHSTDTNYRISAAVKLVSMISMHYESVNIYVRCIIK